MANNIHNLFKPSLSSEGKEEITLPCKGALQPIKPIIELISEIQPERIIRKKDWRVTNTLFLGTVEIDKDKETISLDASSSMATHSTSQNRTLLLKIADELLTNPLNAIRQMQLLFPNTDLVGTFKIIGKEGIQSVTIDTRLLASPNEPQMLMAPQTQHLHFEKFKEIITPSSITIVIDQVPRIPRNLSLPFRQAQTVRDPRGYPTSLTELSTWFSGQELNFFEQLFDNPPLSTEDAVVEQQPAGLTRCQVITRIALTVIGILCLVATIVVIFATIGLHVPGAPQFMATLAKSLSWDFTAYILTAAGPTYLFGLGIYALVQRRRREAQIYRG